MIPPVATPTTQPTQQAEHPYRRAQDATYQPPAAHNFGAPMQQPTKKPETVPKVFPPIYDPSVAANIYKRSMDAPITVTHRELLSLAPEVRSQVREAITTRCTQPKDSSALRTYTKARKMNKRTTISIPLLWHPLILRHLVP